MGPDILEFLVPLFAFIGLGSAILIGMKMRYTHIERTRTTGSGQQDVERMADAVDTLRDEVQLLRDQHLELNERMDFTERLLERPKSADADLDALPGQQN